jgi:hypothetical protein
MDSSADPYGDRGDAGSTEDGFADAGGDFGGEF